MIDFLRGGGFPLLVVVLFGTAALATAVGFARRGELRRIAVIRALTWATVFATVTGMLADLAAVMHKVPTTPAWANSPDLALIVMQGLGESIAPGIMGFTLLALAWLVVAVGLRRTSEPE